MGANMAAAKGKAPPSAEPPRARAGELRLQLMSDLHLEFEGAENALAGFRAEAPVLVLAGDIAWAGTQRLDAFLAEQARRFELVLYVPGNHEFYRKELDYEAVRRSLRESCQRAGPNVRLLDSDSVTLADGRVRVLGCTLWTHVLPEYAKAASRRNDYHWLTLTEGEGAARRRRRVTVEDMNAWHAREARWLSEQIDAAAAREELVVVITHHDPTAHSHRDSPSHASPQRHLFKPPLVAWCYGHVHSASEERIGDALAVSNPLGYVTFGERSTFARETLVAIDLVSGRAELRRGDSPGARPVPQREPE